VSATPRTAYVMTVTPTAPDRVVVNFTGLTLHVSDPGRAVDSRRPDREGDRTAVTWPVRIEKKPSLTKPWHQEP